MVSVPKGVGWDAMGGGAPGQFAAADASTHEQCFSIVQALASETNEALYDVTVRVGDRSFPAHRAILAAQSPVFRAMFTSGMREQQSGCIELGDVAPDTTAAMLRYVYGGGLMDEPPDVLVDVWALADRMQMDALRSRAAHLLTRGTIDDLPSLRNRWVSSGQQTSSSTYVSDATPSHLTNGQRTNSFGAVTVFPPSVPPVIIDHRLSLEQIFGSDPYFSQSSENSIRPSGGLPDIAPHPVAFLASEILIVLQSETFLKFPLYLLARILASDSLVIPELWLFDLAMTWIDAHPSRESNFDDVLDLIRFPLMTHADLGIANESSTANKFSRFGKVMLQALCDKCPMANPRVLGRPDVTFPSTGKRAIPFVVHESFLRVTVRRAHGSRAGIVVEITPGDDESIRGTFVFPYARCNNKMRFACGRPIALWANYPEELVFPYGRLSSKKARSRARAILERQYRTTHSSTIWDVEAGDSVDIALQVFTSPGSSTLSERVRSIPCSSPFLWDLGDVDGVYSSTEKVCHEWLRGSLAMMTSVPQSLGW